MIEQSTNKQKMYSFFTVIVFMLLLILPTIAWGVLGIADRYNPGIMDSIDYDLGENRKKASFPTEYTNSYPAELELYYNDRVPFRSVIISANTDFTDATEMIYRENIRPTLISMLYPQPQTSNDFNESGESVQNPSDILIDNELSGMFGENETTPDSSHEEDIPATDENMSADPSQGNAESDNENGNASETGTTTGPLSHAYEVTKQKAADCTGDGYITYTCKHCNDTYTEIIPATGHNYTISSVIEPDYDHYGYSIYICEQCRKETKSDFTQKYIDTSYFPPNIINRQVVEGRRNWLFYAADNSIEYYTGQMLLDDNTLADYANRVAALKALCDEKGILLQIMILPNKEQVYSEYMPNYTINDSYKRVPRLVDSIVAQTGISILYPINELQAGKLYWQTYSKYDTHWTHAGAFIGLQCLYQSLGLTTTSLDDFTYTLSTGKGGDLVVLGALNPDNYNDDTVYNPIYRTDINIIESQGIKDGEDTYTSVSTNPNGLNFVLIGDSYRLNLIPFLEKDFTNLTVTHRNQIHSEEMKSAVLEADILVLEAVERYDSLLMDDVNTLIELLSAP